MELSGRLKAKYLNPNSETFQSPLKGERSLSFTPTAIPASSAFSFIENSWMVFARLSNDGHLGTALNVPAWGDRDHVESSKAFGYPAVFKISGDFS